MVHFRECPLKGEFHGSGNPALASRSANPDHHPDPAVLALERRWRTPFSNEGISLETATVSTAICLIVVEWLSALLGPDPRPQRGGAIGDGRLHRLAVRQAARTENSIGMRRCARALTQLRVANSM
jgi:hypothetical protein